MLYPHIYIQQLHVKLVALQDLFKYCSFALVLQLALFMLYVSRARRHEQSVTMVVRRLINAVIAALPPTVPAVLIVCLFRCGIVLKLQQIHVHHSTKVKTAAATQVLVLDKTGTLTGSQVHSCPAHIRTNHCSTCDSQCQATVYLMFVCLKCDVLPASPAVHCQI